MLKNILLEYVRMFPAFRTKPIGAPHSEARELQEAHIALEEKALAALGWASAISAEQELAQSAKPTREELIAIVQRLVHPMADDTDLEDAQTLLAKVKP